MSPPEQGGAHRSSGVIRFQLYVAGETPRTHRALDNLRRLAESDLEGRCEVEVIDVVADPARAEAERILATPTLVKSAPEPRRKITGDLSDAAKVLRAIGITPPGPHRPSVGGT